MNLTERKFLDGIVRENCYNFLEKPVIVTAGDSITPFFLNGENVIGSEASGYKKFEMDPIGMTNWIEEQLEKSGEFEYLMSLIARDVKDKDIDLVSGGRTRDWPFAAALSLYLGKPTLFLYKPEDGMNPQILGKDREILTSPKSLEGANVYHIVDLVTTASSIANPNGWIDQIRRLGGSISDVFSIIDRNQGAREVLGRQGVNLESAVKIDSGWLNEQDPENVETVTSYLENPVKWSMEYLRANDFECLMPYIDSENPMSKKDNRLAKFVGQNEMSLREYGLFGRILSLTARMGVNSDSARGIKEGTPFAVAIEKYRF